MHAILCLGDSITYGVGEKPELGWVGRLQSDFGSRDLYNFVVNLGFPGHDTYDLLKRFDSECVTRARIKRESDSFLILIAIGTNDCRWNDHPDKNKFRTKHEDFKKNILELVKKASKYSAKLAFIGIPPVDEKITMPWEEQYYFTNERVKLFNDIIKEVCEKENISFLDIFSLMLQNNHSKLLVDGIHPNSKGYDFIFKNLKKFLSSNNLL